MKTIYLVLILSSFFLTSCNPKQPEPAEKDISKMTEYKLVGKIEILDDALKNIIDPDAKIEILAEGYEWSEGPLWLEKEQKLIWSDVPQNTIFQWSEGNIASVYLKPSGFTGKEERKGEPGSNGLALDAEGQLILCQHGDRRLARMKTSLNTPEPEFETIADKFDGKRFNSPNDVALGPEEYLYFTDPPYGLEKQENDPGKELPYQGVYKVSPEKEVTLLTSELSRPNGIAFNPEKTKCYVANSDPGKAIWMVFDLDASGNFSNGKLFFDATAMVPSKTGLPDGLKVNKDGILFASGPGGILIFSPEGKHLGTISTGEAVSNCALSANEKTLYLTSDMYIVRVPLL